MMGRSTDFAGFSGARLAKVLDPVSLEEFLVENGLELTPAQKVEFIQDSLVDLEKRLEAAGQVLEKTTATITSLRKRAAQPDNTLAKRQRAKQFY
jgi:prefoldin subunit 5